MKEIKEVLDLLSDDLIELNEFIYKNPELGNEEFKACEAHTELLAKEGFQIEKNFIGIRTAFKGTYDSGKPGPTIAYLAEYDALPGIGHGCGHNILGTVSTGAGIALSRFAQKIGGKVLVIGTPAEETDGAKVDMTDQGVFNDIDVVMMAHPMDRYYVSINSLAMEAIEFEFKGQTAHAAACPEKGINALDAAIGTFNNINALREHVTTSTRIHGIIKEGGLAANIVPDKAVVQFYVRATTKTYLQEVVEKVKNCARGASLAAGTELSIRNYEKSYDNFVSNGVLNNEFETNLKAFGVMEIKKESEGLGSIDAGNVSHVCPTIHPCFAICEAGVAGHTTEFAEASIQPYAYEEMNKVMGALVQTGIRILGDEELLLKIKEDFRTAAK